ALAMVAAANRGITPHKRNDLYKNILKEKGRLTPFVISGIKKKLKSMISGRKRR
ncbi:MAG: hypothetical protein HXX17_17085, partial [Geobacteraceae bacterium]|nr:hypothetical protein [Geobacteraceae bacterium]